VGGELGRTRRLDWRNPAVTLGGAYVLTAGLLMVVAAAGAVLDRPIGDLTRDPAAVLDGPAYIGFVSNVGIVVWTLGASACLLAALVLEGPIRWPFVWGGLLTAWLLADDLFLLHESYFIQVHLPEQAAPVIYTAAIVAYGYVFRDFLRRHGLWLLPTAFVLFAISGALDVTLDADSPFLIEDGAKLFGIVTWTVFFTLAAVRELRTGTQPAEAT
jgi:hypothetical protein